MYMSVEHALVSIIQNENDMTVHKIARTQKHKHTGEKENAKEMEIEDVREVQDRV